MHAPSSTLEGPEDEVFFGPLTALELAGMRRAAQRRDTQKELASAVLRMQALCRGLLARQEFRRQRDDMRFLAVKGEYSVERRRRWVNVPRPPQEPLSPPPPPQLQQLQQQPKRGFRGWFHRSSNSYSSPTDSEKESNDWKSSGSPKKMALFKLGSLLSKAASPPQPQQPPPPPSSYTPNVRPLAGYTVRGRAVESMNVGFLTMGRKDSSPASLPCIPRLASAPAVPRVPAFSSTDNTRTYSTPPPPQPPVFGALVGTRTQSTMIVKPAFSSPDNSRNHSTPIVARAFSSSPAAADNTRAPSSSPPIVSSPPLSSPDNSRALNIVASPALAGSPPNNARTHSSPPIVSPIVAPAGQSDTDDDSGIAASVTKLTKPSESAEDPTTPAESTDSAPAITSHLSPRLSLRLSVDGAALGLSAFVAPLPPSPEEEEEEKEEKASGNDDDDDDPVRARLRTLRTRRLANPSEASDGGRRFRATQSAKGKGGGGGGKPLAKMGNLQLDRLTKLNTRRNSTYMACRIERFTVVREGDRPPSPSSAMLARARERKKLKDDDDENDEVSLLNDDSSDDDDMRPITPVSDVSIDFKRKSVELAADDDARLAYGVLKKQCRVHWGSRSILRAMWAAEGAVSAPKPILVNKEAVDAKAEGPSPDLCVVRVACIEYPAHVSSEDEEEELAMDDDEEEEEEEYVPRRSGRRKKVV
ncbi:hypothetical protein H4S07_003152 [Coemansia furcata]|uniref:Uncharacterized protein n=1 Tax=Coemansia furcata TaxID=417177 RepID=A0ACC1LJK9_9FUNG|nr:hypothetical protein H4S07_003152 [Coemansia furcata]